MDRPLTKEELAERWKCCTATIDRMIKRGELQAFRVGAQWRISPEAITKFENGGTQ